MNRGMTVLFATLSALMAVGFSDTAQGQTLSFYVNGSATAATSPVTFNFTTTVPVSQPLVVTSTGPTTLVLNPNGAKLPTWLNVTSNVSLLNVSPGSPLTFTVAVNPNGLNLGTQVSGGFSIGINGQSASLAIPITVNLTVGSISSAFSATPSSLTFTGVQGATAGSPTQTAAQVIYSGNLVTPPGYTLSVSTTDGNNWLLVSPACLTVASNCVSGTNSISGTMFQVSVNPSAPGVVASATAYSGSITAQSTTTTDFVSIPVTFTVSANSSLTVTPSPLPPFLYQIGSGGTIPSTQTLEVTASGSSTPFSDAVTTVSGGNWLVPEASSGTASSTPAPIPLFVSPTGLPATRGTYTDVLTITPTNGAVAVPVNVNLVVTTSPLLQVSSNALSFSASFGSTTSATQQVTVTSTGAAVGFAIALDPTAPWLTAATVGGTNSASSTTAATINLTVNPVNLAGGTYTGTIQISPTTGDQYSLPVTVTFTIATASQITAGPPLLHFSWETTQTSPGAQNVQIGSVGQPVSFAVTVPATTVTANCPANWLQAGTPTSTTTPATLPISVVTSGMTTGSCTGTVVVTPTSGSGITALNIPVTIDVAGGALLNVTFPAGFGMQTVPQGAASSTYQIFLTSTDPSTQVPFTAVSNVSWLTVAYNTPNGVANTPQNLQVTVSPGLNQLTPGTYRATITISSASLSSGSVSVPYTLTVSPNITVAISPSTTISFTEPQGGPVPQSQNLTLTSTGGSAQYTAQVNQVTGGNWLLVNSASSATGTINPTATLALSINSVANSLGVGTYTSTVTLAFPGTATANATVTVNLTVAAQAISVAPTSLSFSYQTGSAAPQPAPLSVTSTGGTVSFNAVASSTGNWLSIDTSTASTPKTVNVSVNPQNIPAGSAGGAPLTGTVSIQPTGTLAGSNPTIVNVTLTVTASPTPQPSTITSGASLTPGAIAPGEFITIKGINLGPATAASFSLTPQGGVSSTLAGVQVLFDTVPGAPTYVSATQINVVVPYEIAGRTSTSVSVVYQGVQSAPIPQQVNSVMPSIFTFNATGQGQAVAGNVTGPTAGTDNGPSSGVPITGGTLSTSPIAQGSFFFVYVTGGGVTNPAAATGSVNSSTTLMPVANWTPTSGTVTATIGGAPAKVTFAGAAPGLISGVYQVDIQAPTGVSGSALPLVITFNVGSGNPVSTPAGVTVAVQ